MYGLTPMATIEKLQAAAREEVEQLQERLRLDQPRTASWSTFGTGTTASAR